MTQPEPKPATDPSEAKPQVYLATPCYNNTVNSAHVETIYYASKQGLLKQKMAPSFSILTHTFNLAYAHALTMRTKGITHFCMLHDDIVPSEFFWLDKMMALMKANEADILSVVSPIKDEKGLTSTALDLPLPGSQYDPNYRLTRLTLKEIYENYPPTFTHEKLLVNSGLMLVDITKPFADKICFRFENRIEFNKVTQQYDALVMSEDWLFSRDAAKLGAKIFATREVPIYHCGSFKFPNTHVWGEWDKDRI